MAIDVDKYPYLFSTTTRFAYNIDNDFYDGKHYVWVALRFDDDAQAASSNPLTIATDYARSVMTLDAHSAVISGNIAGVWRGAEKMKSLGRITGKTKACIKSAIIRACFEDFFPLVYVIDTRKVYSRIIEVPPAATARVAAPEYKIYDLQEGEYELLDLSDIVKAGKRIIRRKVK